MASSSLSKETSTKDSFSKDSLNKDSLNKDSLNKDSPNKDNRKEKAGRKRTLEGPRALRKYKSEFSDFEFFFYKLDSQTEILLSRQLALLGAKRATFFSAKECTHVITTLDSTLHDSKDTVLKNAKKWKKPIWSLEYIQGFLKKLRRKHRPAYYQFPGYYLMIEDATGKHCAINIKEYDTSSGLPRLKPKRAVKGGTDVIRAIHALEEDCLQGSISSVETKVAVDKVSEDYVEKKKKQALYCETCKLRCEDLDEHLKTPSHLEAYQANDFSELDSLLSSLTRKYRQPLPKYMKENVNPTVDGSDVEFES